MKSSTMKILLCLFLVFQLFKPLGASCGPSSGNLTCSCTDQSITCRGYQDHSFDIISVITQISPTSARELLDFVAIDIESLTLMSNFTFENVSVKSLQMASGLSKLDDIVFKGLNESLVQLNLSNNNFQNIPSNALNILSHLEYLDMSHNSISSLKKNDFLGLASLKILDLQHNSITVMTGQPFILLTNLESLHLDFNHISDIDSSFHGLNKLRTLSVASNCIHKVDPDTISKVPSLKKFVLNNNSISLLENLNIASFSLLELFASNCSLCGNLENKTFDNLPNLTVLDLSFNKMKEVKPFALSKLQNLTFLNLSHNEVVVIRNYGFSGLHYLKDLNLEGNNVAMLEPNAFNNLTLLGQLNLKDNNLSDFVCAHTLDLFALEMIDLQNNRLKSISSGTFFYSPQLKMLKMNGNPLDCTCSVYDFADYLRNNTLLHKSYVNAIYCNSPPHHRRLVDVDFTVMKCKHGDICNSSKVMDSTTVPTVTTDVTIFINSTSSQTSTNTLTSTTLEIPADTKNSPVTNLEDEVYNSSTTETQTSANNSEMETSSQITTFSSVSSTLLTTAAASTEKATVFPSSAHFLLPPIANISNFNDTMKLDIKISNFSHENSSICVNWSITTQPTELVTCSISDKVRKTTEEILCPSAASVLELYCVNTSSDSSNICIEMHTIATNTLIAMSCISSGIPEGNFTQNTTETLVSYTTTPSVKVFTQPMVTTEMKIIHKPFNFTYLNIMLLNSTSVRIEWKVSRKQPRLACHLNLTFSPVLRDNESMLFDCTDNSFVVQGVKQDIVYEICLVVHHVIYGIIPFCHETFFPSYELGAAKSGIDSSDSSSKLPIAILTGLLVVVICIAIFLASRTILRKKTETDRYNVSDAENKVERRERHCASDNSIRCSYRISENFDD